MAGAMPEAAGRTGERGQDMVEYALVLPLLLLILFGLLEFGYLIFNYNTLANATREGARHGVIRGRSEAEIEERARFLSTGLRPEALDFTISGAGCKQQDQVLDERVRITGTYTATLMTGSLLGIGPTVQLRSGSTMYCE